VDQAKSNFYRWRMPVKTTVEGGSFRTDNDLSIWKCYDVCGRISIKKLSVDCRDNSVGYYGYFDN